MSGRSLTMATLSSGLYGLGAAAFIFVYSALMLLVAPFEGGSVLGRLRLPVVNLAELSADLPYQLAVTAAAGLLYGALVVLVAVLAWPIIAFSSRPEVAVGRMTRVYVLVFALNLVLFALALVLLP